MDSLPGRRHPGLRTPGAAHPGAETPGYPTTPKPSATGVAIDATGTTDLGTVPGDRDIVIEVAVTATATDFNFNVNVGGVAVFDSAQTVSSTSEETFAVSVLDGTFRSAVDETVQFEVTSASGTAGATADVTVSVHSEEYV